MAAVLEGVRVIAVEQYGAGPFGTQYLAELGAEVVSIGNAPDGFNINDGCGALHVAPPLTEEMNPASSLQVDDEQDAFG